MAKQLIRYLLEGNGTVPVFVEDGGYMIDTTTDEVVGVSVDEVTRNLPVSVFKLTRVQLKTRMQTLGHDQNKDGSTMTSVELDTHIQAWLDARGMGGLV